MLSPQTNGAWLTGEAHRIADLPRDQIADEVIEVALKTGLSFHKMAKRDAVSGADEAGDIAA